MNTRRIQLYDPALAEKITATGQTIMQELMRVRQQVKQAAREHGRDSAEYRAALRRQAELVMATIAGSGSV